MSLFIHVGDDSLGALTVFRSTDVSLKEKIRVLLRMFDSIGSILVIDGLDVDPNGTWASFFQIAKETLSVSCVVVTTVNDLAADIKLVGLTTVHLDKLAPADARDLVEAACRDAGIVPLGEPHITVLLNGAHGHPFLIRFLVAQLRDFTPDELMRNIDGVSGQSLEYIVQKSTLALSGPARATITFLSTFRTSFRLDAVSVATGGALAHAVIRELVGRRLLQRDNGERFSVHSLISRALSDSMSSVDRIGHAKSRAVYYEKIKHQSAEEYFWFIESLLDAGEIDLAKKNAERYIGSMMNAKFYALALTVVEILLNNEFMTGWFTGRYVMGRLYRILGSVIEAKQAYRLAADVAPTADEKFKAEYEWSSCVLLDSTAPTQERSAALQIFDLARNSPDLTRRTAALLTAVQTTPKDRREELLKELEDLIPKIQKDLRPQTIQAKFCLAEILLDLPERADEGEQLLRETADDVLCSPDSGQFALALAHFLGVLIDRLESTASFPDAKRYSGVLIELHRETGRLPEFGRALFDHGRHCCVTGDYSTAQRVLSEAFLVVIGLSEDNAAVIASWLVIAAWNRGQIRAATSIKTLIGSLGESGHEVAHALLKFQEAPVLAAARKEIASKMGEVKAQFVLALPQGVSEDDVWAWAEDDRKRIEDGSGEADIISMIQGWALDNLLAPDPASGSEEGREAELGASERDFQ